MPPMPLTYSLQQLKTWGDKSGIPFQGVPQSKNTVAGYDGRSLCMRCGTCDICPTGAKYSPDFTFKRLLSEKKIVLHDQTLIRRLVLHDTKPIVVAARGVHRDRPQEPIDYRARTFVVASGYSVELAPAAAVGHVAVPERVSQPLRPGGQVHERATRSSPR